MVEMREKVSAKFGIDIKDIELSMGMSGEYAEAVIRSLKCSNFKIGEIWVN